MPMVDAMRDSATMTSTSEETQNNIPDTTGPGKSKLIAMRINLENVVVEKLV